MPMSKNLVYWWGCQVSCIISITLRINVSPRCSVSKSTYRKMCGLAVGKVAEGTARLGAQTEKKWKIFKASALQVWCILTSCVKILCVSLGCDFGTVPLCSGQILFEMQEGRAIFLLSANPWAKALLVKRWRSLFSTVTRLFLLF